MPETARLLGKSLLDVDDYGAFVVRDAIVLLLQAKQNGKMRLQKFRIACNR